MTTAGLMFMAASWAVILGVSGYAMWRLIRGD